jgi:hypothetical protein
MQRTLKGLKTLSDPQRKLVNLPEKHDARRDQRSAATSPNTEDTLDRV